MAGAIRTASKNTKETSSMKKVVACVAVAAALSSLPMGACAQGAESYPDKPIQIVVPFAPGGGSDTLARAVGQKLGERWKQPVIVVNKPGADGNIGAQFVAAAPKDGYTLMVLDVGTLTIGPVFYKSLPFDPLTAFAPVTALTFSPHTLVVNPALPAKTFSELREYAKANPDKLNFANHNNSAALAGYKLSSDTGVKMTQIPYKGAGAAMTGLIGGEVNVTLVSLLLATPQINSGTLRAIAVASPKRMSSAPAIRR
jgi:tripartite-type tricarboxylate transporter receptor subunit TctC